jgi:hypothetical protein
VTTEQKVRGLCCLLVAVQEDEKVVTRLFPRFREAVMELAAKLNAKGSGKRKFPKIKAA